MAKAAVTDVAVASGPDLDLGAITDFQSAVTALKDAGVIAEQITDYGDGFILLSSKDKGTLVKVPFVIVSGNFRTDAQTKRDYLSMHIVTADGRKLVVNDGSVGLFKQAESIAEKRGGSLAGLIVSEGLTGGEYTTEIDGEIIVAATYYFAGV